MQFVAIKGDYQRQQCVKDGLKGFLVGGVADPHATLASLATDRLEDRCPDYGIRKGCRCHHFKSKAGMILHETLGCVKHAV
jgi:hypothetical protein